MLLRKEDIFSPQMRDIFSTSSREEFSDVLNTIKTLVYQVSNTAELVSKIESTLLANEEKRIEFIKSLDVQGKSPEEIQGILSDLDKIAKL